MIPDKAEAVKIPTDIRWTTNEGFNVLTADELRRPTSLVRDEECCRVSLFLAQVRV